MEGVGARLGRSSTRYGVPATVFSGPVRKWKKKWVNVPSPNSNNHSTAGAARNGNNPSHLLLYKWTPISSQNGSSNNPSTPANGEVSAAASDATASVADEPPRRKFRYVPVSELEEQKEEAAAKTDDEANQNNADGTETETECSDAKPDVDDVPMEEAQASGKDQVVLQEASETSLDLSLGLKSHDGKHEMNQSQGDVGEDDAENKESEAENRGKRKVPDLEMRV